MEERSRSPFPGMDPYLEDPRRWTGVHASLVACLWDQLAQKLPPRYYASPQERVVPELADRVVPLDLSALDRYRPYNYLATINRGSQRSRWEVYPIPLSRRLPRIPIPLLAPDPDVPADLQAVLDLAYERGRYAVRLDYTKPPVPPLEADDERWARDLVARVAS